MKLYKQEDRRTVNVLLNPDDFYGRYTGHLGPILLWVVVCAIPWLLYSMILIKYIPFKWFISVWAVFAFRMLLIIPGKESQRLRAYENRKNNIYADIKDLVNFKTVHRDGCIEYNDNMICYVISCYTQSYFNNDVFSKDAESFIKQLMLITPVFDIYGFTVVDETKTKKSTLEKLKVFIIDSMKLERLRFYKYQDTKHTNNSMLYNINFVCYDRATKFEVLKEKLTNLTNSGLAKCFYECKIRNQEEVIELMSRDTTLFVNIKELLMLKFKSDEVYGSKIIGFNAEEEQADNDLEDRREIYDK